LGLPPGIPPATYELAISLFETHSGNQLPLIAESGKFLGMSYVEEMLTVLLAERPLSPTSITPAVPMEAAWLDGRLQLLGLAALPAGVSNGDRLPLELFWHTPTGLQEDLWLRVAIGDVSLDPLPLSRFASSQWRPGETVRERYQLPAPVDMPAGRYPLTVSVCRSMEETSCPTQNVGELEVYAIERLFVLPREIQTPLNYTFVGRDGSEIQLHGATLENSRLAPGEWVELRLYWESRGEPDDLYTAFVHINDANGAILAQMDQWPGGLPSTTWAPGQIIVDSYLIEIPAGAAPGSYTIAIGLYTANDGLRLEAVTAEGQPVADQRLVLPLVIEAP